LESPLLKGEGILYGRQLRCLGGIENSLKIPSLSLMVHHLCRFLLSYFRFDLISGTQANRKVQPSNVLKSFCLQVSPILFAAASSMGAAERFTAVRALPRYLLCSWLR
jgi:hypothetical protein